MGKTSGRVRPRGGRWWLATALACAGCGSGGSATGPSSATPPPPPLASILTWSGTATYSETISPANGNWRLSFTGPVTWQKNENPDPALPLRPGYVPYRLASGQMRVTYEGTRTGSVECTDQAAADVVLVPNDPPDDPPLQSYLAVGPEGQYVGSVYNTMSLSISRVCPATGFAGSFPGDFTMRLWIEGTLSEGRRMQGSMVPESTVGLTRAGSWDFSPR